MAEGYMYWAEAVDRENGIWEVRGPDEHERGYCLYADMSHRTAEVLAQELEKAYWLGKLHGVQEAERRAREAFRPGATKAEEGE